MPARTNMFQKLVLHLHEVLADGFVVEESAFLVHRLTGKKREVDIVIRSNIAGHEMIVALECIDKSRPADVGWVEKMHMTHQHLDTGKLVLVSRKGFSKEAQALAEKFGVVTLTPEAARAEDWPSLVVTPLIHISRHDYRPISIALRVDIHGVEQIVTVPNFTAIHTRDGAAAKPVSSYVDTLIRSQEFASGAMDGQKCDGSRPMQAEVQVQGCYVMDSEGNCHNVRSFIASIEATRNTSDLAMEALRFRGQAVAIGSGSTMLGETLVSVVPAKHGKIAAKVIVDGVEMQSYYPPQKLAN